MLQLEIPLETVTAYAKKARAKGVTVVLNAAPAQELSLDLLALIDILIVNQGELAVVARHQGDIAQCLARIHVPCVVVTLGPQGCGARADGVFFSHTAFDVTSVDSTGAGDTFCGVLVAALSRGKDLPQALRLASAAGALACTRPGAQDSIPTAAEVADFLATQTAATPAQNAELRKIVGFQLVTPHSP